MPRKLPGLVAGVAGEPEVDVVAALPGSAAAYRVACGGGSGDFPGGEVGADPAAALAGDAGGGDPQGIDLASVRAVGAERAGGEVPGAGAGTGIALGAGFALVAVFGLAAFSMPKRLPS